MDCTRFYQLMWSTMIVRRFAQARYVASAFIFALGGNLMRELVCLLSPRGVGVEGTTHSPVDGDFSTEVSHGSASMRSLVEVWFMSGAD